MERSAREGPNLFFFYIRTRYIADDITLKLIKVLDKSLAI